MKTALITGTSRGIGKALAEKFMSQGWKVIGTCVSGLNLPSSHLFFSYDLDLSSGESIESFTKELLAKGEKIDIIINNAGVCIDEFDSVVVEEKLRKTLEINLVGVTHMTENLLPLLSSRGQVFNMSSTASMLSKEMRPFKYPAYKISKTALNMFSVVLASRLKEDGKFVASIHPGWVKTEMGGEEADMTPEEAAGHIYNFAVLEKEMKDTGLFWFKGEKLPW